MLLMDVENLPVFRSRNPLSKLIVMLFLVESLKWVYIPDSIQDMGSGVFASCIGLKEIRIPKGSRTKFEKLLPFSVDKFVEV